MKSKSFMLDYISVKPTISDFAVISKEWSKPYYSFPEHRIYYVTEGNAIFGSSKADIVLEPGYLYLIPAYFLSSSYCEKMCKQYYVHFEISSSYLEGIFDLLISYKKIAVADKNSVIEKFENIISSKDTDNLEDVFKAKGNLLMLLSPFFKDITIKDIQNMPFKKSLKYIENNIKNKIKIEDLANIENLSTVYFSNKFSKSIGLAPRQYIIHKKLSLSQYLLRNSNKTAKQISYEVGLNDAQYFSKLFKRKFGITPLEYRHQL